MLTADFVKGHEEIHAKINDAIRIVHPNGTTYRMQ